jgi:hypothetical protein
VNIIFTSVVTSLLKELLATIIAVRVLGTIALSGADFRIAAETSNDRRIGELSRCQQRESVSAPQAIWQ